MIIDAIKGDNELNVVKEHINTKIKGLIQKLAPPAEPEEYEPEFKNYQDVPPALNVEDLAERPEQNQNLHPNVHQQIYNDEYKTNHSVLRHSEVEIPASINNYQTPHKIEQNTPNSRPQRGIIHSNVKNSNSNMYQNPISIHHMNEFPDQSDEYNRIDEEEHRLSILQRLPHKKWSYRRNAYKEIADEFIGAAHGQTYTMQVHDQIEQYSPYERFDEWLLTIIRDTNLVAQFEALNTLYTY